MANPKIKYDIEAAVSGDAEVGKLASKLEALGQELDGDLKVKALAAAAALRQLGEKQNAITQFVALKEGAQGAAAKLNEAQAAAQKMGRELSATAAPTRAQTGQMQKLSDAVRAAKAEVIQQNEAVIKARAALQQFGLGTTGLAQAQAALRAAIGAAKLEVNALIPAYGRAAQAGQDSANRQKQAAVDTSASVAKIGTQLQKIQQIAMIATGGGFLGSMAKDALYTADAFNNLQARIKIVTGAGPLLQSSFQGVSDIALRTNSDLEQTSTLFTRIAQAGKSAGMGAKEAADQSLALTETINQAIQLSGGSVDSAKAAVTQLIQGLQSGVLRGEEFNSVMEQAPRLALALADGLGRTTGELRKMSMEGGLTTDVVIRALRNQADAVKTEFGSLPPTVGRAIQNLSTSWMRFVGDLDKSSGSTKSVAGAIDSLSGNLSTAIKVVGTAGQLWGGYAASNVLASAGAKLTASAIANSAAAAAAQGTASAGAAAATRAHGAAAAGAIPGIAGYGAAAAGAGRAAAAGAAGAATGMTGFGGAALAAASKFALWGTVAYVGYGLLESTGKALGEGIAKWQGYADAEEIAAKQEKELAAAMKATAEAQYKQSEAVRIAKNESFGLTKAAGDLLTKFDAIVKGGDSAAEAIGKIGKDFDLSRLPGIQNAAGVLDRLLVDGKLTASEFQAAWATALSGKDLVVFDTMARAAFKGTKREAELLAELIDAGLRESVKRAGLDFESLRGGVSKVAKSAVNDTQTIIDGLGRLSAQGIDTGRALEASIGKGINTADTQQALQLVKQQIEDVRSKLGETVTNGLLEQAKEKALALGDALDKAKPGINSLREAMAELGMKSREDLAMTAQKAQEAYGVMKSAGQAEGESYEAWQRRKSAGAAEMLSRMIEANSGVATAAIKSRAAMEGLEIQTDSTGKSIVTAMSDGEAVARGLAGIVDGLAGSYGRAGEAARKAREDFVAANGGSVVPTSGGDRAKFLAGQSAQDLSLQFSLLEKIQQNTLSEADLADAKAVVESLKVNAQTNRDLDKMGGAFSAAGSLDRMKWDKVQTQLQIFIDSQKNSSKENPAAVQSNAGVKPAPASTGTSTSHTVTINLGSTSTLVNTASAADAATLTNFLQGLETAALRAS